MLSTAVFVEEEASALFLFVFLFEGGEASIRGHSPVSSWR